MKEPGTEVTLEYQTAMINMENIIHQDYHLSRIDKEKLLNQRSALIWFTGLSGSGKSTIANELANILHNEGILNYTLDGDNIRLGINNDLGFSSEDRSENLRRIGEIAKLFVDAGVVCLAAFVSPELKQRELVKSIIGEEDYIEVFVNTPLHICEKRDVKGLYQKARKGEIKDFTGISAPYDEPIHPNITVHTENRSPKDCALEIYGLITERLTL